MGRHSLTRWPELIAPLSQPVFFQQEGTLLVWHRQDAPEATRMRQQFDATRALVTELPAVQSLDAQGMAQIEPALAARFGQGMYLPGEGQLDNRQLLGALLMALQQAGVCSRCHVAQVLEWSASKHTAAGIACQCGYLLFGALFPRIFHLGAETFLFLAATGLMGALAPALFAEEECSDKRAWAVGFFIALGISAKTVEVHLTRVYRKLGIRSRAELGRRLDHLAES